MKKLAFARFLISLLNLFPRRHPLSDHTGSHTNPFFIFGSGRNGSTLLNVILNQHSNIFLPSEQYFLGNSIIKYQLYNHILWRDLVKIIYGELIIETGSHSWNFSPQNIISEAMAFRGQHQNLQNLIQHIYLSYARKTKVETSIWGDSTPYNTQYLNEIHSCFPKAKYIFLLRDGRDVMAAYKKAAYSIDKDLAIPVNSAKHWLKSLDKYDWLKRKSDVHLVKYEDLVLNTEATIKSILNYLGFNFEMEMLRFHENVPKIDAYNESHHSNLHQPIQSSSIGQWQHILEEHEKELILPLVTPYLEKYNYL